jgi:hypothetical protein
MVFNINHATFNQLSNYLFSYFLQARAIESYSDWLSVNGCSMTIEPVFFHFSGLANQFFRKHFIYKYFLKIVFE